MSYFDGFVLAVPTANREAFIDHARRADALFLEYGAVRVVECWGDDVPDGKQTANLDKSGNSGQGKSGNPEIRKSGDSNSQIPGTVTN